MSPARTLPWPLVALFTAGYLAPYLLPTTVGRLDSGLPLTATQAGAIGSALLLSSAAAGFLLASRVDRFGPRALARAGLASAFLGYGGAAVTGAVPAVVAGALLGGFGSGTVTAVAASGIAAHRDPHRVTTLGLLGVSALAGALYLTIPHLGPGHGLPLAAVALTALAVWPFTGRLPARTAPARTSAGYGRLPHPRAGLLLAAAMPCWSLAQNSLWGVSGRIGLAQAHLTEVTVGAVFAIALGAGLLGVLGAGALGPRLGRALPIGGGTALIAACIALSASATDLPAFAAGEISWNLVYPVVLSYVIGLAASLDPRGRWAVLVGSASSLGTAAGPLAGSLLAGWAGFPGMGLLLGAGLLLIAVPMTAVALRTGRRPVPVVELPVVQVPVETPAVAARQAYETASPNSYASTSAM
ncbi:Predicted arabinose efflux permease, MFS family [Streptomyces sp. 1222.5]|uniref:MFS transporter n=1 Tax=unclassified Streptomyces TaxID=2593676 RepID=UPI00089A9B69|nr:MULTISPECIES: MFS transporter [unclassified Streptomyces]PKW07726.1 putative MFS family arabinose efflux permease [Streptomyces sp. 5112.2]SEC81450.1 Predicted arabinose efflux permease, MFS family [Streptomyces sp. 1222.5]SEC97999.1 Predicted arabinose efflux permease, MFS family [Streptomyces sp. 2231.1]